MSLNEDYYCSRCYFNQNNSCSISLCMNDEGYPSSFLSKASALRNNWLINHTIERANST